MVTRLVTVVVLFLLAVLSLDYIDVFSILYKETGHYVNVVNISSLILGISTLLGTYYIGKKQY